MSLSFTTKTVLGRTLITNRMRLLLDAYDLDIAAASMYGKAGLAGLELEQAEITLPGDRFVLEQCMDGLVHTTGKIAGCWRGHRRAGCKAQACQGADEHDGNGNVLGDCPCSGDRRDRKV